MLGPDLATAHFVVAQNGSVKFDGFDKWFQKGADGKYFLPLPSSDVKLEAVNVSNTNMIYESFDNFGNEIFFSIIESIRNFLIKILRIFSISSYDTLMLLCSKVDIGILAFPADIGRKLALPVHGSRQRLHTARAGFTGHAHTPANEAADKTT